MTTKTLKLNLSWMWVIRMVCGFCSAQKCWISLENLAKELRASWIFTIIISKFNSEDIVTWFKCWHMLEGIKMHTIFCQILWTDKEEIFKSSLRIFFILLSSSQVIGFGTFFFIFRFHKTKYYFLSSWILSYSLDVNGDFLIRALRNI